ncbi:MAG: glycosyltransferase [Bacteroidota bacterium]
MISVCIPVYNIDIRPLITSLEKQISKLHPRGELVIIDDASDERFKKINREAGSRHKYVELRENVGRARIRNMFLRHTRFEFLLFLDCDSLILSDDFLSGYAREIQQGVVPDVIVGGRVYSTRKPSPAYRLRWKYGVKRENKTAEIRNAAPYNSFLSNNFLIKKEVLGLDPFDERLSGYGHEDTLFAYTLKKNEVSIVHIDNPVLNGDLEKTQLFLTKTAEGISNLRKIQDQLAKDRDFFKRISLLRCYNKIGPFRNFVAFVFDIFRPLITFMFSKGIVILALFDFYKLGVYLKAEKAEHSFERKCLME